MAKVNEGSMRQWLDGETIHAAEYNNERTLIIKAFNDTDKRVDDAVRDMKAPFSVNTGMIADGAVTPTKVVKETVTQYAYDKTETDQRIIDALTDGIPQEVIDAIVLGAAQTVTNHANDQTIHVTTAKQAAWNAKETPQGAYEKDIQTLEAAKTYTDQRPWQKHRLTNDNGLSINISSSNLNNLLTAGNYAGESMVNAPSAQWHYIRVQGLYANVWVKQEAINLVTNTYQMRTLSDSGWSAWSPDIFTEVAAAKQAGVDAKQKITTALNAKGQPAVIGHSFDDYAWLIGQISTGIKGTNGALSNVASGTISNLAFTPKILVLHYSLNTTNRTFDPWNNTSANSVGTLVAYTGISGGGLGIPYGGTLSYNISGSNASQALNLANIVFGTNSVSFGASTDGSAFFMNYTVFGV